jgi:hypothetical protein
MLYNYCGNSVSEIIVRVFEDTKGILKSLKSSKDRQRKCHEDKQYKKKTCHRKLKIYLHESHRNPGVSVGDPDDKLCRIVVVKNYHNSCITDVK